MQMTKLYISGAIKDTPDHRQNFAAAVAALRYIGYETVNPLDIEACADGSCMAVGDPYFDDGVHTWSCYLKYDLIALLQCDGIAMLDRWYKSKGALLEFQTARAVNMPIKDVKDWYNERNT